MHSMGDFQLLVLPSSIRSHNCRGLLVVVASSALQFFSCLPLYTRMLLATSEG